MLGYVFSKASGGIANIMVYIPISNILLFLIEQRNALEIGNWPRKKNTFIIILVKRMDNGHLIYIGSIVSIFVLF